MKNLVLSALSVLFSLGCMAADHEIPVGRTVDITGVERIEAFSSVKVHYTQGKGSTVLVKENGTVNSEVTVNGKTLCIKLPALEKSPAGVSRSVGGRVVVVGNNSYDVRTEVFVAPGPAYGAQFGKPQLRGGTAHRHCRRHSDTGKFGQYASIFFRY